MDLITNQLSKKIHTYLSELYYFELLDLWNNLSY